MGVVKCIYYYSRQIKIEKELIWKFEVVPLPVFITPDEVTDTYVAFDKNLLLSVSVYKQLIEKAKI